MNVRLMSDLDLQGKTVVFREDLNVPVKEGKITSDKRIRAAIPSLKFALDKGAGIIVLSHLGRPEEGVYSEEASLAPVAKRLEELLGVPVRLEKDYLDGVSVKPGECVLCENVRFNKGEKKNNEEVARKRANWPLERESTPEEIAQAALFLAGDQSATITGTELTVDSGVTMCLLPYNKHWEEG